MPDTTYQHPVRPDWFLALEQFERPDWRGAIQQVVNSLLPYLAINTLMFYLVLHHYPYWVTILLAIFAAGFLIRCFILLHDCSHSSFFPSQTANTVLGYLVGVLTMTPYVMWRWTHLKHHGAFGNLDKRGLGDIKLMTVEEYQTATRWQRFSYRLYRHPLIMFGLGSTLLFALIYRFPVAGSRPRDKVSVLITDAAILAVIAGAWLTVGVRVLVLVQAPILIIAWAVGVWMFYVQHQFEGVYWARQGEWEFIHAALYSCSYYRLPKILQWFTGNIGIHHLHHMRPRIPNFHLQEAYDATPAVQVVTPLTLRSSLQSLRLNLWDEQQRKLVGIREVGVGS